MKIFIKALAIIVIMSLMFVMSVSAVGTFWTFDDEKTTLAWADKSVNGGEVGYENGSMVIRISSAGDPYFQHGLGASEQFDCAKFPFVKIRYKVVGSTETLSEFFWSSSVTPGPVAETNFQFNREENEDWVEYIEKIADTSFGTWSGIIDSFRIDPIQGQVSGTEVVYVDYIAFFTTEEEAKAWQPAAPAAETVVVETAAADAPVENPIAAQTSDLFSVAIIMLAITTAAGVVICRRKQ